MEMIGPKQRWKNSLKKHILMVLMRLDGDGKEHFAL
jgi:hypothetical protein